MTEEFDTNQENNEMEPVPGAEEISRPLPYAADPVYQELLHHYQNADWDACSAAVEKLLQKYPEDEGLLEFQHEIQMRNTLLRLSLEAEDEDKKERRKKLGKQILIGVGIFVAVFLVVFWGYNQYQARVAQAQLAREQAALEAELSRLYTNAENFLDGGRAEEALELYRQIEALDPAYMDVPEKIEEAEGLLVLKDKYENANQLYQDGELEKAAAVFREILEEDPRYADALLLLTRIENTLEINRLMGVANQAYLDQGWKTVVETVKQIQEIDASADISSLDEALFTSYLNLVIETAERADATQEEVDEAYQYYRAGLAIFPQDKNFENERSELQRTAINLLANKYLIYAKELVGTESYSIQEIEQALTLLNRANNIGAGTPAIASEIRVLQLYLSALTDFNAYRWDSAISSLEELNRTEADYANGIVPYLLFEAYLARGITFADFGEYSSARNDFDKADIFANGDSGNKLRLFAVQLEVAKNLRRLSLAPTAAEYFRFAINMVNFQTKLGNDYPERADTYAEAEADFVAGDYWNAARLYELATEDVSMIYEYETISIQRGDAIALVAYLNGSSVGAILTANPKLGDSLVARTDMEIQVPVLVEDQN